MPGIPCVARSRKSVMCGHRVIPGLTSHHTGQACRPGAHSGLPWILYTCQCKAIKLVTDPVYCSENFELRASEQSTKREQAGEKSEIQS